VTGNPNNPTGAPPQTARLLRAARQPWSVNGLACAALAAWATACIRQHGTSRELVPFARRRPA
jgi:histidinol-phosphate/aromatic aminotransferase/cobyric acid decarboxylase-like protein